MSNPNGVEMRVPESENFDVRQIAADPKYSRKTLVLDSNVTDRLAKLLKKPETLRYFDKKNVKDVYNMTIYLNNELVVSGFDIDRSGFPDDLQEFLKLLFEQVKCTTSAEWLEPQIVH
ncbi:MAG: hypothetical protein IPG22_20010 [Acidobacteria bacterium]|nr:hypothetical protein [Acidobacteriota bacterium]